MAALPEDQGWLENKINYAHSLGIKYVSALSPITAVGKVYNQRPDIAEASCLNIHGEKIQLHWYPINPNEPFYWGCTNNPTWQEYLKEVIERSIDAGADGIHVDEIYGTAHAIWGERGCFCDYCMDGFRNFLKNKYSEDELKNEYGITDIDSFHYGDYIINNGYSTDWEGDEPWRVPLWDPYNLYQELAVQHVMKNLISETKQYALDNFGRKISYSANINDLNPSGLKFTDDLDVFILEYFYFENGYPPIGKASPQLKLAHSLDQKPGILMTAINTNADLLKRSKTSNLMKIYIVEAYATQGSFLLP